MSLTRYVDICGILSTHAGFINQEIILSDYLIKITKQRLPISSFCPPQEEKKREKKGNLEYFSPLLQILYHSYIA